MSITRRDFLKVSGMGAASALIAGCAGMGASGAKPKVVVVGAGYGGATCAKYLRKWGPHIEVTLIEPNDKFVSCPRSNLVIGGLRNMDYLTHGYDNLPKHGIRMVKDTVVAIDPGKRTVTTKGGTTLGYDRLVLAPGIDVRTDTVKGFQEAEAAGKVVHAWKAGAQTALLRKQLEAMPDGGVYALSIPLAPYRCPPGPYERACQVAHYFSQAKPKSKVLILDANDDVTSKGPLFKKAWADRYKGIIEYRPKHALADVDAATGTLKFEFNDDIKAQVLNVIPPMRAGDVAHNAGLTTANKRWCDVDWLTMESKAAKNVHILGDALQIAPAMPKSGHMANQHGKVAAAAIVALLSGRQPNALPIYNNTCYSFVSDTDVVHVASVHAYDAEKKTMLPVAGSGGVSSAASELEGRYAMAWARNIWADTLA